MLTIRQLSSGAYFNPFGTGARTHFGPLGLDGVPASSKFSSQSFPIGRITTSKEKTLGDRNCHHDNLEGVLIVDTEFDRPYTADYPQFPIKDRICTDASGSTLRYNYICNMGQSMSQVGIWKFPKPQLTHAACADYTFAKWCKEYAYCAFHEVVLANPSIELPRFIADVTAGKLTQGFEYSSLAKKINPSLTEYMFIPTDPNNWFAGGKYYVSHPWYRTSYLQDLLKKGVDQVANDYYNHLVEWSFPPSTVPPNNKPLWLSIPPMAKMNNADLRRVSNTLFNIMPNPLEAGHPLDVWGALTCRLVDKSKAVDINSVAFLADLAKIRDLIPPIPKSISGVVNPKYLSKVFLWWNYGVKSTYRDVCSLAASLQKKRSSILSELPYQTIRSSMSDVKDELFGPVTREYHGKLIYSRYPNYVMEARTHIDSLGLYPNLLRSWDLIPFSFVLDWVFPIGDILDKADKWTDVQYFDVWSYTKSYKLSVNTPVYSLRVHGLTLTGSITRIVYDRHSQRYLDVPKLEAEYPKVDPSRHWAESLALLISVKR